MLCTLVRIHSSWEQFVMAEIRSTGTQSRGTFAVTHHMIIRSLIIADPCGSTPLPCSRLKSTLRFGHARRQVHGSHASHQQQVAKATSASVRGLLRFVWAEHGPGTTETPSSGFPSSYISSINTIRYYYYNSPTATIFNKLYKEASICMLTSDHQRLLSNRILLRFLPVKRRNQCPNAG